MLTWFEIILEKITICDVQKLIVDRAKIKNFRRTVFTIQTLEVNYGGVSYSNLLTKSPIPMLRKAIKLIPAGIKIRSQYG